MIEEDLIKQESDNTVSGSRPVLITIICLLCLVGAIFIIPLILSERARNIGPWYPTYLAVSAIVGTISMAGLWLMKKWAVYLYTGFVIFNQFVLLVMGVWNINAIIIPGVVITIGFIYLNRMN